MAVARRCTSAAASFAGGLPVNRVARWDGTSWSALGTGLGYFPSSLGVFDDGGGNALFATGDFSDAGGVSVNRVGPATPDANRCTERVERRPAREVNLVLGATDPVRS